ncbi:MAG: hypothetical protein GQ559_10985 [Desulfobulbaceae bacterium]|nr:hypothetical protein [Desulfobulbaceae bacterium]
MTTTKEWNCLRATWLVLLLALAIRLVLSSQFLLVPDEANYWQWSRYLDLGYHDHPPMIAWTIWISTSIFGHNEFAVRLPTVIGLTIASLYMCLLAARWFSYRCALHTAILSQGILLINGSALISTPDGLLLPCWAAACYHAAQALDRNTTGQWLLTGIWFGLGMLSKYTMLLFLPSLFLCMLFTKEYRNRLLFFKPWLGLVCGMLFFTPVLIWNSRNEWTTFRHVLYQGGIDNHNFFTLRFVGDFFGAQAALLSPIVMLLIFGAWWSAWRSRRIKRVDSHFLIWMSLTTFVVFLLLSFHVRIYGNWPAPAYVTALILIAALYSPAKNEYNGGSSILWKTGVVFAYLMTIPVLVQIVYPVLPIPIHLDRTADETTGWDDLAQLVHHEHSNMKRPDETFIFGLRYQFASELAFYLPGQPKTVSINRWTRPNVYDFWTDESEVTGKDAVGIYEWEGMKDYLARVFDRIDQPEQVKLYRTSPWNDKELVHTLYLIRGYGFKGGLRWQPKSDDDIRVTN